jgi:hypothetical protein
MQGDGTLGACAYCLVDPPYPDRPSIYSWAVTTLGGDAVCERHARRLLERLAWLNPRHSPWQPSPEPP